MLCQKLDLTVGQKLNRYEEGYNLVDPVIIIYVLSFVCEFAYFVYQEHQLK